MTSNLCKQVRQVDQTWYPMTVVASLSAVPRSVGKLLVVVALGVLLFSLGVDLLSVL